MAAKSEHALSSILPKPFDERKDPLHKEWKNLEEKWDERIPKGGFISDFVYYNRGNEAPTAYAIWCGLVAVSAAVRKKAWIPWDRGRPLCANLYVILVGPPGLCKKGTIMSSAGDIVERFPDMYGKMLPNSTSHDDLEQLKEIMSCRVVRDKVTPEALIRVLASASHTVVSSNGKGEVSAEPTGSQAMILVPELSIFMGKEKYAQTMGSLLTRLYDGDSRFEYIKTSPEGNEKVLEMILSQPFLSFIAGTTEGSLRDSVSEEAKGGGLLSRLIIIAIHETARVYPKPLMVNLLPKDYEDAVDEMASRLAWVSLNAHAHGRFNLSKEADQFYDHWYRDIHKPSLEANPGMALVESRASIHLLKTAMLVRAARYEVGNVVELEDIEVSMNLVQATKATMMSTLNMVDSVEETRVREILLRAISTRGEATYRQLSTGYSRQMKSKELKEGLRALMEEGKIRVLNMKTGETLGMPLGREFERYEYSGGGKNG